MIPVVRVYVHVRETFLPSEYETIGQNLYEYIDSIQDSFLPDIEKGIEITIQEGSTKAWIVVGAILNALINYGDLRQSVDYIMKDGTFVANKINNYLKDSWHLKSSDIISQRNDAGVSSKIKSLFDKVDRGELTSDEATTKAVAIIRPHVENHEEPELSVISSKIRVEFKEAHEHAMPAMPKRIVGTKVKGTDYVAIPGHSKSEQPEVPSPTPTNLIPHDASRPKRLTIRKRPHDRVPVFEYF